MESQQLEQARLRRNYQPHSAIRIFHGPGEGEGELAKYTLDKYADHAWITYFGEAPTSATKKTLEQFCQKHFQSAVLICRHKKGDETQPATNLFGATPAHFLVTNCDLRFEISFRQQRHPGLFLDLDFVRRWLKKYASKKSVLNLFSYTGSLSAAAGAGGADLVVSVDLSKPFTEWARRNWAHNNLLEAKGDFIFGDVFEWLKKFKKQNRRFDIVVCDPPSFSRGKKSDFSTARDLAMLHQHIFDVLADGGQVVTSINSESLSRDAFLKKVKVGADPRPIRVAEEFGLPPEFPGDSYLKGAIIADMKKK